MIDKLTVKGLGSADGEYEFDVVEMLMIGTPSSMNGRELHRLKLMAGIRAGEIQDALTAGDYDFLVALAAILLARNGRTVSDDRLWDATVGSVFSFDFADREAAESPPEEPAETPETEQHSTNGGGSSKPTLALQENDPSRTGPLDWQRSAISDPQTLAT